MLYLRTGGNGSCKTLFTLRDVRDLQLKENRPVYFVEGRFEPKPILTQEFGWLPIAFKDWELCEEGAIILCDEVHYDLPRRSPSSAVPPHIAHLSEHRKRGMDFFLLTQHPMNIDEFVRRLVQALIRTGAVAAAFVLSRWLHWLLKLRISFPVTGNVTWCMPLA